VEVTKFVTELFRNELPLMAKAREVAKRGHKTGGRFICMGCPPLRSW